MEKTATQPETSATGSPPSEARWWWALALSIVLLAAVYAAAVLTATGQSVENAALRGADQVDRIRVSSASGALNAITIWSLAGATALVGLIGLLRRQLVLATLAVGVIVGGQVVTQSLKRFILPRPELVPVVGDYTRNSFPSGHTTIAMTVLVAILLVVPYRWRGLAMLVVMTWAVAIGTYTLTAKWHRLSDTLGADLVALALGSVAAILLVRSGRVRRVEAGRSYPLRVVFVMLSIATMVIATVVGTILMLYAATHDLRDPVVEWDTYLAATNISLAGSLITGLLYWWTWRRLEVRPARS